MVFMVVTRKSRGEKKPKDRLQNSRIVRFWNQGSQFFDPIVDVKPPSPLNWKKVFSVNSSSDTSQVCL